MSWRAPPFPSPPLRMCGSSGWVAAEERSVPDPPYDERTPSSCTAWPWPTPASWQMWWWESAWRPQTPSAVSLHPRCERTRWWLSLSSWGGCWPCTAAPRLGSWWWWRPPGRQWQSTGRGRCCCGLHARWWCSSCSHRRHWRRHRCSVHGPQRRQQWC